MQHFADKQLMIADAIVGDFFADKVSEGTANEWRVPFRLRDFYACKAIGRAAGKLARDMGLVRRQNAYAEVSGVYKCPVQTGIDAQAPLHERRFKRHRAKRIRRHAHGRAVFVEGCDDGNAGRKTSEGVTQG